MLRLIVIASAVLAVPGHAGRARFSRGARSTLPRHLRGTLERLALALVALGLYIAASLLMQHSVSPRVFGGLPLFAAIGYGLALWFTLRIVRGIAAAERDGDLARRP